MTTFQSPCRNCTQLPHCHQATLAARQSRLSDRISGGCSDRTARKGIGTASHGSCIAASAQHLLPGQLPSHLHQRACFWVRNVCHPSARHSPGRHGLPRGSLHPKQVLKVLSRVQLHFRVLFLRAELQALALILSQSSSVTEKQFSVKACRLLNSTCPRSTQFAKSQIQFYNLF